MKRLVGLLMMGMTGIIMPFSLNVKISTATVTRARTPVRLECASSDTVAALWEKLRALVPALPPQFSEYTLLVHGTTLTDAGRTLESYFVRDGETLVVAGKLRAAGLVAAAASIGCP